MEKVFQLHTDYKASSGEYLEEPILADVMNYFLAQGYKFIQLIAEPLREIGDIYLPVDKDVEFLLEGYLTLGDNLRDSKNFKHFCFLGDGLLEVNAAIRGEKAEVAYRYCPGLNRANLIVLSEDISLEEYCYFWEKIANVLLGTYKEAR